MSERADSVVSEETWFAGGDEITLERAPRFPRRAGARRRGGSRIARLCRLSGMTDGAGQHHCCAEMKSNQHTDPLAPTITTDARAIHTKRDSNARKLAKR